MFRIQHILSIKKNSFFLRKHSAIHIPVEPVWDLIPLKKTAASTSISVVDIKKLEKLSMLKIDAKIEKDLIDVLLIAERMSKYECENYSSLEDNTNLNSCKLRKDEQILTMNGKTGSDEDHRIELLKNARFTYDDYLMTPPSKFQNE